MTDGYSDDFTLDLGWVVSGNPSTGDWERDVPVGTTYNGNPSNPGQDVQTDCMDEAYVTGNGGGNAGDDDIDGGQTVLTSPMFDLTSFGDPYIHFDRWFFNDGGQGTPNDSIVISLSNGLTSVNLDVAIENTNTNGTWVNKLYQVSSVIAPTANMQVTIRAMDDNPGHIVEAGFDNFIIADSLTTSVELSSLGANGASIYPNPFKDELTVKFAKSHKSVKVEVFEITGKIIDTYKFSNTNVVRFKNDYKRGVYFINIYGDGEVIKTQKVVKL